MIVERRGIRTERLLDTHEVYGPELVIARHRQREARYIVSTGDDKRSVAYWIYISLDDLRDIVALPLER